MGLDLIKPQRLHFGPAGIPISTPKKSTPNGVRRVAELGLDAMEIEFVRGVRMNPDTATETQKVAHELHILLTVHAPYYINLLSNDESKVEASIRRILDSARVGYRAGGWSVVFHSGYYGKKTSKEAIEIVRKHLKAITKELMNDGIDIWVRPELMGGLAEVGSLEEILEIVDGIENALPCLDFAHLYARSLGEVNNYEEFRKVLIIVEKKLGKEALRNSHIHVSGMEYGKRGERRHLNLSESDFKWVELLKVLKEFNIKGALICESPNLEEDAMMLMKTYATL
jgi:deoxyribonuclease-4